MYEQLESYEQQTQFESPSKQIASIADPFSSNPVTAEQSSEPEVVHIKDDPGSPPPGDSMVPEFIDATIGSVHLVIQKFLFCWMLVKCLRTSSTSSDPH